MNSEPLPHRGTRLLVVEDDRLVLATLLEGLTHAGYGVTGAESAEEAEAWLASGTLRPDLAILDVRMPGQGGLYLAQRLRDLDHIPFMMLSAYSDPATVEQAAALGALGYVVKPVDTVQLIPAVQAALARADELGELRAVREQLQSALDAERDISIAVGLTMAQRGLARRDAFELIRQSARSQRRKLAEMAAQLVQSGDTSGL